ncbi:MAG: monovalent cation/H+ antiporter complex subunit F [Bacillota bacterium]|nr:monovalent cation/H+ antiporter complex subunit F [Bacillota bacterium]
MSLPQILDYMYNIGAIIVMLMIFMSLIRALVGPTAPDRVTAINIIGTKTLIIITLIARIYEQKYFLDIAMVYALMSFITTIGVAKYLEKGALD